MPFSPPKPLRTPYDRRRVGGSPDSRGGQLLRVATRHFLLVDTPTNRMTYLSIKDYLDANPAPPPRHQNSAIYFPRLFDSRPAQQLQAALGRRRAARSPASTRAPTRRAACGRRRPGTEATLSNVQQLDLNADRRRERRAQSAGDQLPAHLPGLRQGRAGARARWTAPTSWPASGNTSRSGALALFIEESLYRGTKWVVFEPNDEPLWAQIRLNVGAFMQDLFRQGAFQGTTPREAYFVKCDKRDDDPERHRPRHRQHPGRLRAAQAGRVRRHQDPADRRPDPAPR